MKQGILYFHQGWSDIFNSLSLIDFYYESYDKIKILIRADANKMVEFYTKNKPKIEIIYLYGSNSVHPIKIHKLQEEEVLNILESNTSDILFHGEFDKWRNDKYHRSWEKSFTDTTWMKNFYSAYNIDPSVRLTRFNFERDLNMEEKNYNDFIYKYGRDYILYHYDEFSISGKTKISLIDEKNLSHVQLNGSSESFFEYIKILENAKELHLVDSVWGVFCYILQGRLGLFEDKKIYLYPQRNLDHLFDPLPKGWEIIYIK